MTTARMIELAAALVLLGIGIWLYRRRARGEGADGYGSQGAVLLLVVAAIMGIHALGGLDYHPREAELEIYKSRHQQ